MLSKSAARAFFLVGTAVCAGAFVLLTVDTIQRVPAQTNAQNITDAVKRGHHLWDSNNCMGCHTILGEGAYYAPELTKVIDRRGEAFVASMLKDPEKMYPGQRKMTNYHFSDEQVSDLVEFFKWIGKMDLNGFPPKPNMGVAAANAAGIHTYANKPKIFDQVCITCHSLGGTGGQVGPALDGVADRRDKVYLGQWLHDPQSLKADAKMPKLNLQEEEIASLVEFLSQLKQEAK